jgi:kynureninase
VSQDPRQCSPSAREFDPDASFARSLDREDPLADFRGRFRIPEKPHGGPVTYLCGNSLGLQPIAAEDAIRAELEDWARLAVDAHFEGRTPWFSYHTVFREPTARLVGARPDEVVTMNGLTVNLHLMLVSFFTPDATRFKVLMEENAFPSDTYAVKSHLLRHGLDPDDALLLARSRPGETTVRTEDIEALIEEEGERIALVILGGVNYYSGQLFDLSRIASCARRQGCRVGYDLAHVVGNVPLALHDWNVDFAVWCSYKYLNGGPGTVAGCFVHERHLEDTSIPRLAGWWGNDPQKRFRMHLEPDFVPVSSADGWQLSNPPILALAPLRASFEIFDQAGMQALRQKSLGLTGYLESWIDAVADERVRILTPRDPGSRGCQISLEFREGSRDLFALLQAQGIVGDYREPDAIRVAPVPLYNTFYDVWRFGDALRRWSAGG